MKVNISRLAATAPWMITYTKKGETSVDPDNIREEDRQNTGITRSNNTYFVRLGPNSYDLNDWEDLED